MRILIILIFLSTFFANGQQNNCLESKLLSYSKGTLEWQNSKTYDKKGNLIEDRRDNYAQNGVYSSKKVYEYDGKGRVSKITDFLNDAVTQSVSKEYDNLGNLIREVSSNNKSAQPLNRVSILGNSREQLFYESDGKVSGREIQEFDKNGQLTLKELRGDQNKLYQTTENTYNSAGQIVKVKRVDVVGNMTEEIFTNYDGKGNILSDSSLTNGNVSAFTFYTYDNGFLTKKAKLNGAKVTDYEIIYLNNTTGKVIEETFVYNGETLSTTKYEYDTFGNKIKEDTFDGKNQLLRSKVWEYICN